MRKWLSGEKPTEAEAAGTVLLYDDANKKPRRQTRIGPSFEPWPAFSVDEKPFTNRSERTVKMEHSRGLLTRLQHEVYAQRHTEAMRLVSLLLREFNHLKVPLAQTGFELLCGVPSEQARLQRYAGLMARFDNKNRTTWLISAMHERLRDASAKAASAASAGASSSSSTSNEQAVGYLAVGYAEGMEKLRQVLHSCDGVVPCSHDGDLHGLLGLLGHARLQLASTQLPADLPPSEGGAKVDPLPFTIDATVWKHAPPALISASRFREQKKRIRIVRRRQRWEQHAMKAAAAPPPPAAASASASQAQPAAGNPNKRPRREEAGNLAPGRDYSDERTTDNVEAYHNEGEEVATRRARAAGARGFRDAAGISTLRLLRRRLRRRQRATSCSSRSRM